MTTHLRHPDKIDKTLCKELIFSKGRKEIQATNQPSKVTCGKCLARLRVVERKNKIVEVLQESPKPRKTIGKILGMYKLHSFMADLTAEGAIKSNRKTGCFEVVKGR